MTGLPRPAQATQAGSRDAGNLPPWLNNAQDSAVVARLRRNLETQRDKPYLSNKAGRASLLVQETSEGADAGDTTRLHAYHTKATQTIVHGLPEIDIEDIKGPTVGKNEIAQAEKEADRLRMELFEVKEQLRNSEMASTKLVDELLNSKRELNTTRDKLESSASAAENAAKRAKADLATLRCEMGVVRSELAGKVSELNEIKPQLDLARMQLRILQETHAENSGQGKTAEMHTTEAGLEMAVVKAQCGAKSKMLAELNKENPQADQIPKMEAELQSAQNAQVVLQDASWMMTEPIYNMLHANNSVRLDRNWHASCVWHPQSLPEMSQFCTQDPLAPLRQQQYMLQLQQQQQQQQQAQYYQALRQQQPHHQMDVSHYEHPLHQTQQKSVQLTQPVGAFPCRTCEFEAGGHMLSFQLLQGHGPAVKAR